MNLNDWFNNGITAEQYINNMSINKEEMLAIKQHYSLKEPDAIHSLQNRHLRALVLTADWCGDAMVNLPIFMTIADQANIDARYFIRDENMELMDQFLTNGTARSIPIIVLINEDGSVHAKWGPRAKKVQHLVDESKSALPPKEHPDFEQAFKQFIQKMTVLYTTDNAIWEVIEEDMLSVFTNN
ncbi:thioredoxin family protein [Bacillus sp. AGMB 02131]|uniref:Thioredoxin family protein n=1 Tax=Peribacillus faecalis TaxID=2772559 RepID=A0A927CXB1_9BACI|nr:thioredoxin family protein [Peribacillus faecalis]MBD3108776.1 thioredoxin family protein [Peribacillus faecalis]